jgi:DNA repair protein RadC
VSLPLRRLPPHERPRERLLALGPEALTERELLALVLGKGRQGESALDLAASLLVDFDGLAGLAEARPEELAQRSGIGPAKAAAIVAAFRLGRLAGAAVREGPVLRSAEDAARVAMRELAGLRRERVIVLVCDGANRLRRVVRVAEGSIDRAPFPVREILNAVLRHDGRAFVVAHNHPAGDPTPSDRDRAATAEVVLGAKAAGLRLLGHVVVAALGWSAVTKTGECVIENRRLERR